MKKKRIRYFPVRFGDYTPKDVDFLRGIVDTWYLTNRPMVQWWRIPSLEKIRNRVVKILERKRGLIISDGLGWEIERYKQSMIECKETWENYKSLNGNFGEVIERFKRLESKERIRVTEIEKLLGKVGQRGIPVVLRDYVPEITIMVI